MTEAMSSQILRHSHVTFGESSPDDLMILWLNNNTPWKKRTIHEKDENWHEQTSLHAACQFKAPVEIIESLVRELHKDIVLAIDANGNTALHYLVLDHCEEAHLEVMRLMLHLGGRNFAGIENHDGCTALDEASNKNTIVEEQVMDLLMIAQWVPGGTDVQRQEDFRKFNLACRHEFVTLEVINSFIASYGLPIEELFYNDECFDVVNFLYNTMVDVKDTYPSEFSNISTFRKQILDEEQRNELKAERNELVPIERGRLTVVGEGRTGKTSTINWLRGMPFNASLKSTGGIHIFDDKKLAMDLGIEVSDNVVSRRNSWVEVERRDTRKLSRRSANLSLLGDNRTSTVYARRSSEVLAMTGQAEQLHLTIWDYGGGQIEYQNVRIDHMCMPRHSCYLLVFRISDLLSAERRETALAQIDLWLKSIKVCAVSGNTTGRSKGTRQDHRHAPVLLIGTHFDEINKSLMRTKSKLRSVNNILVKKFGSLEIFQTCKNYGSMEGREDLYNKEQDLCFWPVDNTNRKDTNLQSLRDIIVGCIVKDPFSYANYNIPESWSKIIEDLIDLSPQHPLIKLYSKDDKSPTIMGIMRKYHALDDIVGNDELCRKRVVTFMRFCNHIGTFVYFDSAPSLQNYCILDRQWIIDTLTYIVRDFKLHRFRRDYSAMELENGCCWRNLLTKGVLDVLLLQRLWLGEEKHMDFLVNLMINLGAFAKLPRDKATNERRFLVPGIITVPFDVGDFSHTMIEEHLLIRSIDDGYTTSFHFEDESFSTAYYNRVVAHLVTEWRESHSAKDPILLPDGCLLSMECFRYALLINTKSGTIEIMTSSKKIQDLILPHIFKTLVVISKEMFKGFGGLREESHDVNSTNTTFRPEQRRNSNDVPIIKNHNKPVILDKRTVDNVTDRLLNRPVLDKRMQSLTLGHVSGRFISFFRKHNLSEEKARKFAELIMTADPDLLPENLKLLFDEEGDRNVFRNEILRDWMGMKDPVDQRLMISILSRCPKPKQKEDYFIGYFCEDDLNHVEKEKSIICQRLAPANLSTETEGMGPINMLRKTASFRCKVLHLAMHGNVPTGHNEVPTLAFTNDNNSFVSADDLTEAIALCCRKNNKQNEEGSIECIFFNVCQSFGLAKMLKERHGVQWVLSWETDVDDEAAMCFAAAFYHFLGISRDNCQKFEEAYKRACSELKLRGWTMIDPDDQDLLFQVRRRERNVKIKAAGKPHLYSINDVVISDRSPEPSPPPCKCSCVIS